MTQAVKPANLQDRLDTFFGLSIQIISAVFVARFILAAGVRFAYPFIPQLSAGLGLSVVGFGWLIFIRAIVGVTSPIFGVLADRLGRRKIMAAGLAGMGLGMLGVAFSWQWWAIVPMLPFGLGITAFVPAGQAYISDQVAYNRRGRVLGTVEFSWALAGIVALPLIGWLIDTYGWRSPFLLLSLFSLIAAAIIWFGLPAVEHRTTLSLNWLEIRQVCFRPNVLAAIGTSFTVFLAEASFFTIWGIWLNHDFGLGAVALGLVATGIGLAELTGSGTSAVFIDRLGKRRGSQMGLLLIALFFVLLPLTRGTFWLIIAGLLLMGLSLEFTIVSLISLYSEQVPQARATVFSLAGFGTSVGVALGVPIATSLWVYVDLWAVCIVAAISAFVAFNLVRRFLGDS